MLSAKITLNLNGQVGVKILLGIDQTHWIPLQGYVHSTVRPRTEQDSQCQGSDPGFSFAVPNDFEWIPSTVLGLETSSAKYNIAYIFIYNLRFIDKIDSLNHPVCEASSLGLKGSHCCCFSTCPISITWKSFSLEGDWSVWWSYTSCSPALKLHVQVEQAICWWQGAMRTFL